MGSFGFSLLLLDRGRTAPRPRTALAGASSLGSGKEGLGVLLGLVGVGAWSRPAGRPWSPYGDSLGTPGGSEKQQFLIRFLAICGPIWAYNRPSRGYGWLSRILLWRFGTTNVDLGAKTLDFRGIFLHFSGIFGAWPLKIQD